MRSPVQIFALGLGLFAVGLAGCAPEPSVRLRWSIDETPDNPDDTVSALLSPYQCTRVGISRLELETFRDGVSVDLRQHHCFPDDFEDPNGTLGGPVLPPGEYRMVLTGLRRDGFDWFMSLDPDDPEAPEEYAVRAETTFTIESEEQAVTVDDIVLPAPPQCRDGVDNDGDGFVDGSDAPCQQSAFAREDAAIRVGQFRVRTTFFDDNPAIVDTAHCEGLGVREILVRTTDQQEFASRNCSDAIANPFFFSRVLDDETVEVEVVAVGKHGGLRPAVKTVAQTFPISAGGSTVIDVDFPQESFLQPVQAPMEIFPDFDGRGPRCVPTVPNSPDGDKLGKFVVTDLMLEITARDGSPLAQPVLLDDGTALDGTNLVSCQPASFRTQSVTWGDFAVAGDARSAAGDVCYVLNSAPTAPGTQTTSAVRFERVLPPPPSCADCESDGDCDKDTHACVAGVCAPK